MNLAVKAHYHVVWTPLSEKNRALFNETAAWKFIDDHLGVDYGWEVLLSGWLVFGLITKISFYFLGHVKINILSKLNNRYKIVPNYLI